MNFPQNKANKHVFQINLRKPEQQNLFQFLRISEVLVGISIKLVSAKSSKKVSAEQKIDGIYLQIHPLYPKLHSRFEI